ncbi:MULTISPECIES: hypothetical protein [Mycolicibacter]|uniref:Uncharacterized protein n=2 Tax=Mycolicibacter TaxID=1073531 RepID=A0ABU5XQV8_9MYCO|nr:MULTISPECIES: hypothetical protein [unclassified Mycolicibacter]MEB3023471.1 hypothetical protein [Mycolicibacter sp. MYC098]MEB3035108.1 hypothetical protein [Mycolicibacter sp. MYC340]
MTPAHTGEHPPPVHETPASIPLHRRAELRALHAAATGGKWVAVQDLHGVNAIAVAGFERSRQIADVLGAGADYGLANARCIAAAVNALPEVLEALEAVEAECAALRARLASAHEDANNR